MWLPLPVDASSGAANPPVMAVIASALAFWLMAKVIDSKLKMIKRGKVSSGGIKLYSLKLANASCFRIKPEKESDLKTQNFSPSSFLAKLA